MTEERFIRLKNGGVYRYGERLAKRKDAQIVDGYTAAEYYRSINSENDITEKYPRREIDKGIPEKSGKPRRTPAKKPGAGAKSKTVVSDDKDSGLKELLGDAENLLTGD